MKKKRSPTLYLVAGPNGAGKTTFAKEFLPRSVHCFKFVNADYIAAGLSPLAPEHAAIEAGRVMLSMISSLSEQKITFGFETTLAGRTHINMIKRLKCRGYKIHIFFLWLPSSKMALERIAQRVRKGGHNIPRHVVRRRYKAGWINFLKIYRPLVDFWSIWDASKSPPEVIVEQFGGRMRVFKSRGYGKMLTEIKAP